MASASPWYGTAISTLIFSQTSLFYIKKPLSWIGFWIISYALTALILFLATQRTFDRCLGRAGPTPSSDAS